jgi:serine O-acetyltransferase
MSLAARLVYLRDRPGLRRVVKELLALYGMEVPPGVRVGPGLRVMHRGFGTVIHPGVTIGANVTLYHGVTIGRADPWVPGDLSPLQRIVLEDDVVVCPGAVILGKTGVVTVGRGTVVGANAVLTSSTGPGEVWAGVPARCVGRRDA